MGLARVREVVDAGNALNSDLIVVLGDYFATHRFVTEHVPPPAWAAELARLRAPLGVYSILGNHDWWYDITGVRKALRRRAHAADGKRRRAHRRARAAASGWPASATSSRITSGPAVSAASTICPARWRKITTDDPVILLVHEPDIFTQVPERVSLTLAGHTHGGQIRLPLVPPVWAPSEYGARFAYGHIVERGRHLIVSGGLGCSKVPLRLGVPPEILRIELGSVAPRSKCKNGAAIAGAVFEFAISRQLMGSAARRSRPAAD